MLQASIRFVALCLLGIPLSAQTLAVSVEKIDLKMLQGGPLPVTSTINVTTSSPWTAATSDTDVVTVDKAQGTGNATLAVNPIGWRNPGKYSATITVTSGGVQRAIPVALEVLAWQAPKYTYIKPPVGCTDVKGFDAGNAAVCVVPNEKPPGAFTPPAVGQSYQDPNFGATVRVIGGPDAIHGYSSPSPISAKSKYALISVNQNVTVVDLLTGKKVRDNISAVGLEGSVWDAVNDNYLYGYSGNKVIRLDVTSGNTSTIVNYSGRFQSITAAGTADKSKDNWLAFYAPTEKQICTLSLSPVATYCGAVPNGVVVDFPTMAKGVDKVSGKRYVIGIVNGPFLIYSVNTAGNRLDFEGRGPENVLMGNGNRDGVCDSGESCIGGGHGDTMEDSSGNQFLVTAVEGQGPCEYSIYSIQLARGAQMGLPVELGGGLKRLVPLFRCGGDDHWVDFHTGCATQAPDCAISITNSAFNKAREPNDASPLARTSHMGEIMVVHDNGAEVRRLVEHRSVQFTNEENSGYWSAPRGAISPDGGSVIATSNFGVPNQHRVIVITTGFTAPRLVAGNPVLNAASYEAKLSPGMLAIAFGGNFTTETQAATFPLPAQLAGVSVKVANIPAPIFSVSPGQVAFLVPDQVPTSGDVPLEVSAYFAAEDQTVKLSATIPDTTIAVTAPSIFVKTIGTALMFDVQWNPRPLHTGDVGTIFCLGLGATNPSVPLGDPSPLEEPLARVVNEPAVYINDVRQPLLYSGLVPGMSSVYQIVFTIDSATVLTPDNNRIWVTVQGTESTKLSVDLI
jgi:uncharacterized protein (TIGR03437 family)